MNRHPIGIGIIGYGRIGAEHAAWINRTNGGRVVCVADPTPPRRALAASSGFNVVPDVETLLRREDVAVVLVASPTSMHFDHADAALQAGKHVMVEKPMTLDLPTARTLVERAEASARLLSVFHNRRWDQDFLAVQAVVASGVLGRVFNVESRLGQFASCVGPAAREYRPNWRNERAFGGGGLFDWGSHFLDQAWRLLHPDRPTRVFAQLRGNVWTDDCDDLARVCIDFASGAVAVVEINTTTTRPLPRWHVDGTDGSLDSPHSPTFDTNTWANLSIISARGSAIAPPPGPPRLTEVDIWQRFIDACQGRGRPAVLPRSVLPTMTLLDAARQSSVSGHVVPIDPNLFDDAN